MVLSDEERIDSLNVLLEFLHVPLEFRSTILKPRYHLGVAETKLGSDLVTIRRTQVLLVEKSLLEFKNLLIREGRSTLALLLRLLTIVEQIQVIGLLWKHKK